MFVFRKRGSNKMFEKGEYVVYGINGPCLIEEITKLKMPGCDTRRKYYVLRPVTTNKSVIYSPVDNDKVVMRKVATREEAAELLKEIPSIEEATVENEKLREATYKNIMKESDLCKWVGMIKMLLSRRKIREAQGRKFTAIDERYLKETEDLLDSELCLALGEDRDTVRKKIADTMREFTTQNA